MAEQKKFYGWYVVFINMLVLAFGTGLVNNTHLCGETTPAQICKGAALAEEVNSDFLRDYVAVQIDAANLRALVRTVRMGKSPEFLRGVLIEGGEIPTDGILTLSANHGSGMSEVYGPTRFAAAAEAGAEALRGGPLTKFEKLCDDAVGDYLAGAQYVPFGEAPLVGYLAARETEYTNLRILLMGRGAGLPADVIRSRLRASYV